MLADDLALLAIEVNVIFILPFLGEVSRETELGELSIFLVEVFLHVIHVIAHDAHRFGNTVEIKITSCSEGTDQVFTPHGVRGVYQHQDKEHAQCKCDDDGDVSLRAADGVVDREKRGRTGSSGTA